MKHILQFLASIVLYLCLSITASAQLINPTIVDIQNVELDSGQAKMLLKVSIDEGWYAYAPDPGDTGVPFEITFDDNVVESAQIEWPEAEVYAESIGEDVYNTNIYRDQLLLPVVLTLKEGVGDLMTDIELSYGVCREVCLPVNTIHTVKMQDGFADKALLDNYFSDMEPAFDLWMIAIFAFLGGMILNLMPCVLPVLSIKLMNVIKYAGYTKFEARKHLLITSLGIVVSFLLLAFITIFIRNLGLQFGWGFHFQEPIFLVFLCVVLWVFALNLWGEFEIMLPAGLADRIQFSSHSYQSSFYAGAFATLLATPCTAPFITTSVAFALSRSHIEIIAVYALMGLGMAFPYYAIAASKRALHLIPKPGKWMNNLKKLFAVMILCTLGWLVYVLSFQISGKSIAILVGCLVLVKFALTGWKRMTRQRVLFLIMAAVIAVVLPMLMNDKDDNKKLFIESSWEEFSEEALRQYIEDGNVVFVDVTAEWCLICKTNKFFVLDHMDFINHLKARDVILMRADFTNRSPEIAKFLEKNGRYGIPFNAVYSTKFPEGIPLSEILKRQDVYDAIERAGAD